MAKKYNLDDVLAVGDRLFRKKSYAETGTDEILKEAEFPRSSFYYHFGSKDGFAEKTIEFYSKGVEAYMHDILNDPKEPSPLQRLKNYFLLIVHYSEQGDFETVCLIQRFSIEQSGVPGRLQETAKKSFSAWIKEIEVIIEEGQNKGEIRDDQSVNELAHYVFSVMYGMFTLVRLNRNGDQYRHVMEMAFEFMSNK